MQKAENLPGVPGTTLLAPNEDMSSKERFLFNATIESYTIGPLIYGFAFHGFSSCDQAQFENI
jgi:hypothetical protein